jgi:hypothetical protein
MSFFARLSSLLGIANGNAAGRVINDGTGSPSASLVPSLNIFVNNTLATGNFDTVIDSWTWPTSITVNGSTVTLKNAIQRRLGNYPGAPGFLILRDAATIPADVTALEALYPAAQCAGLITTVGASAAAANPVRSNGTAWVALA